MSKRLDDLMRKHLDGDLGESERRELLEMLREDAGAREEAESLESLGVLLEELRGEAPEVPDGLEAAVMDRVRRMPPPLSPWWQRLGELLSASPWRLPALGGALLTAGLVIGLGIGRVAAPQPTEEETAHDALKPEDVIAERLDEEEETAVSKEESDLVRVHFVLHAPDASRVSVVGDFNGWDVHRHRLERAGDVWRAVVPLPRGRYEYQFVVDGETWLVDPAAEGTVDDGFGGRNAVLEV